MYMKQSDLLGGVSKDFLGQIMGCAEEEFHKKGDILFEEGDPATYFYILLEGRVRLTIGETGHTVYGVDHREELFGWSSILGRESYSASAECREETRLLKIRAQRLQELVEKDPANGLILFRHLANALGARLLQSYKMLSGAAQADIAVSFGTGQVQESDQSIS